MSYCINCWFIGEELIDCFVTVTLSVILMMMTMVMLTVVVVVIMLMRVTSMMTILIEVDCIM